MIGIGAANIGAGFFQGFRSAPAAPALPWPSRPGPNQVTGLVGALAITLMLLLAPGLLRNLQPTLAAVVITASLSLADIPGTVRLWRQRRTEFALSMAAFAGVALLSAAASRSPWPCRSGTCSDACGGRTRRCSAGPQVSPATMMCAATPTPSSCRAACCSASTRRCSSPTPGPSATRFEGWPGPSRPRKWIVVAAEPITDVDTTAADMLEDLDEALNAQGSAWSSPS